MVIWYQVHMKNTQGGNEEKVWVPDKCIFFNIKVWQTANVLQLKEEEE